MFLNQYKGLGVINRTPNSFSDQGLHLQEEKFHQGLELFLADPAVICDFGFESTAPMNKAISQDEERERFFHFLEDLKKNPKISFKDRYVSFDTYRPSSFLFMAQKFKEAFGHDHFIFNDVSGILDAELKEALLTFKGRNFYYIYSFTHIPSRDRVQDHMKFLDESGDILSSTRDAFSKAYYWFKDLGMENQLILDAAFGFSKSYEDNWRLIEEYGELVDLMAKEGIRLPHLVGLSKKSFLKTYLKRNLNSDSLEDLERLHSECIEKIRTSTKGEIPLLFRVHDSKIL